MLTIKGGTTLKTMGHGSSWLYSDSANYKLPYQECNGEINLRVAICTKTRCGKKQKMITENWLKKFIIVETCT